MFNRPNHQRIAKVLQAFDSGLLQEAECFFGGGTAIALLLGEYRESVDIDFLCSSNDGYRILRNAVSTDLGSLLKSPLKHLRDVRVERDSIRTVLEIDGQPIKVEFLKEGNSPVSGVVESLFGIPTLSRVDMFTQKLLANADRGLDKSTSSRDIIDLAMMIHFWGSIPQLALDKALGAYGACVITGLYKSVDLIKDNGYLLGCMDRMKMDSSLLDVIHAALDGDVQLGSESLREAKKIASDKGVFTLVEPRLDQVIQIAKVIGLTEHHAVLSLGRSAAIIALSDLDRVPLAGEMVGVVFKAGKGVVSPLALVNDRGLGK